MNDNQVMQSLAEKVERLEARLTIIDMLGRYGRSLDEFDWGDLRELIADDVVARHDAVAPPLKGIDNMFAVIKAVQPKLRTVQHFVTNQHVEIDADGQQATAYAFILAMHDTGAEDRDPLVPAGGAYRMRLARADRKYGWQITEIDVNETWWHAGIAEIYGRDPVPDAAPSLASR